MQDLYGWCMAHGVIPETWREAKIVVKEGKNLSYPEVYQQISVLNKGYKILESILAEWLNRFIGSYISED